MTSPSVPTGVIDFLLHPPLKLLSPFLDTFGPYSGNVTLTQFQATQSGEPTIHPVADSAGVMIHFNGAIPQGLGFHLGWVSEDGQYDESSYTEPIAQLVVQHQFLDGLFVTSQRESISTFRALLCGRQPFRTVWGCSPCRTCRLISST